MSKTRDDFIKKLANHAGAVILEHLTLGELDKISNYVTTQENPEAVIDIVIDHAQAEHEASAQEAQEVKGPKYKKELEPKSPDFNKDKYRETMANPEALNIITARIMQGVAGQFSQVARALNKNLEEIRQRAKKALEPVREAIEAATGTSWEEISELTPYIFEVIGGTREEAHEEFTRLLREAAETGDNGKVLEILDKARECQAADKEITDLATLGDDMETAIKMLAVKNATVTLDKTISRVFSWPDIEAADPNGQFNIKFDTLNQGKEPEPTVLFALSFPEIEQFQGVTVSKHIGPYDKRVHDACANLYNAGNRYISATQIYSIMGNPGKKPSNTDTKKINESLQKLSMAHICINNEVEAKKTHGKYPPFEYNAQLLPSERASVTINGKKTDAIHLFREPPLTSFAVSRGRATTVPIEVLEMPVSMTDKNIAIHDYLIERIAHAAKGTEPKKILFSTIFDRCKITTQKEKARKRKDILTMLDKLVAKNWRLKGYKLTKDKNGDIDGIFVEIKKDVKRLT